MKPIGYGLIGCGEHAWRSHVVPGLEVEGLELRALCDPNAEARYNICHALKVEIHETDEVSLLERRNVDAVVIASPDRFHLDSLVRAVKAGKHVLCEKPMVTSEEELSRLRTVLELALASNLVVTSCHPRRFDHPYTILKQRLPECVSQFGRILAVELDFSYHKPSKQGLHQGLLIDHISHEYDLVTFLLGRAPMWMRKLHDNDIHYDAIGMRSDGVRVNFSGTRMLNASVYREFVHIRFERGHVTLGTDSGELQVHDHNTSTYVGHQHSRTNYANRFKAVMQNFADAIRGDQPSYLTPDDLIENSWIGVALTQSGTWDPYGFMH